ncbi:MAG: hypothetical protein WDM96_12800 [Lacunisphaera sp.]
MARQHGLDPAKVVEAVVAGIAEGCAKTKVKVKLIGILSRTFGPEACTIELEALLAHRAHITALDLAGDEKNWPAELFVEHFKRGRDAGWAVTVHAGEAGGAPSVWAAIRELGATRIGHGVRSIDDPKLMDYLARPPHRPGTESHEQRADQHRVEPRRAPDEAIPRPRPAGDAQHRRPGDQAPST